MSDDKTKKAKTEEKTKKSATKLSKNVEKLVEEIAKLSVLDLSKLVNALQEKLGVSAAAPVVAATAASAPVEASGSGEAAGSGDAGGGVKTVVITAVDNKISAIKAIREIDQNIGLKEAKDMTENLPAEILKEVKAEEAKTAVEKLKAAGVTVEIK